MTNLAVDDVVEGEVARLDGITAWERVTETVSAGSHTLYWAYVKDESNFEGEDCGWVDGIVWTPSAAPVVGPTIEGDEDHRQGWQFGVLLHRGWEGRVRSFANAGIGSSFHSERAFAIIWKCQIMRFVTVLKDLDFFETI